ncbi:MAG: hypothetical protein MUE40_21155 [Anaerolineae bacterium]|jgi:hypothetical protein|nr:hypothetical protein [Anaerolineae bacterium]
MYMVLFVSKDVEQAEEMLDVWVRAGIKGVTILESSGMQQAMSSGGLLSPGLVVSLRKLMQSREVHHRTLFSAIEDDALLERVLAASEKFVGDWSRPDTGILLVLPVARAYGLQKRFS